jgi:hypothetical protein
MDKSAFDNLSGETRAKLVAAMTPEEILEIAKSEGIKLSEEDLAMVSGGNAWTKEFTLSCDYC